MGYVIFGSGGLAKEVIGYLESDGLNIEFVVSPEPFNTADFEDRYQRCEFRFGWRHPCLLAIADPEIKRRVVAQNPGVEWATYVHSSCFVSPHATLGRGCILAPHSLVCGDPALGEFCFLNTNATIGHDSRLGAYSTLFPNTEICGNCEIGEDCIMGIGSYVLPGVKLPAGSKVSAGAVVRTSLLTAATHYGDPRGGYRIKEHAG